MVNLGHLRIYASTTLNRCDVYHGTGIRGYIYCILLRLHGSNNQEDWAMMTETEIQMVSYAEGILRSRGYSDAADSVTAVISAEVERRARLLSPPPAVEWSATG